MQTHAHYLRGSTVLLKMRMEIHNTVAVSCCGYCSVSWFLCITGKMGVKFIIQSKRESNFNYSELIKMIMNDFVSDFLSPTQEFKTYFPSLRVWNLKPKSTLDLCIFTSDEPWRRFIFFERRRGFHRIFNELGRKT